ncbi:hypothetical protein PSAC2689_60210 [Paraburkholderia sacchari]
MNNRPSASDPCVIQTIRSPGTFVGGSAQFAPAQTQSGEIQSGNGTGLIYFVIHIIYLI